MSKTSKPVQASSTAPAAMAAAKPDDDRAVDTAPKDGGCGCEECATAAAEQDAQGHKHHDDMDKATMLDPRIENWPHQHAMTIVGDETLFGVHMTQFYMEEHKYQLVFEFTIEEKIARELRKVRRQYPTDWFVLSNDTNDAFTIPDIASGRKKSYRAQIFQGLPPFSPEDEESPHFYPWSRSRVLPLFDHVTVEVGRIVMFRPFAHNIELPEFATYLIFGKGGEAHMTNLQTGFLESDKFDALGFGPDYDHVMSLAEPPKSFSPAQLEAGIVASLPAMRLRHREHGKQCIPGKWPFKRGDTLLMRYRGFVPEFSVTAGETFLFGTEVCSSASTLHEGQACLFVSKTPEDLLKKKS